MPVRFSSNVGIINPSSSPRNLPRLSLNTGTKITRSTTDRTKVTKNKHSHGKKRKTKVNVAKRSKRASQKKRGRKMSRRQRGGGGNNPIIENLDKYKPPPDFKKVIDVYLKLDRGDPEHKYLLMAVIILLTKIKENREKDSYEHITQTNDKKYYLTHISTEIGDGLSNNWKSHREALKPILYYLVHYEKIPCNYLSKKVERIILNYTKRYEQKCGTDKKQKCHSKTDIENAAQKILKYFKRVNNGYHEKYRGDDGNPIPISCETKVS